MKHDLIVTVESIIDRFNNIDEIDQESRKIYHSDRASNSDVQIALQLRTIRLLCIIADELNIFLANEYLTTSADSQAEEKADQNHDENATRDDHDDSLSEFFNSNHEHAPATWWDDL